MAKKRIVVMYGGKADEHSISCISAASALRALDTDKFEAIPVGITKDGKWIVNGENPLGWSLDEGLPTVEKTPGAKDVVLEVALGQDGFFAREDDGTLTPFGHVDAVFPVLHGPYGEDGTIQGLFQLADIPFVGCDAISSANCMDKEMTHTILEAHGIQMAKWLRVDNEKMQDFDAFAKQAEQKLGYPMFVKPANAGSSVGVGKAHDRAELKSACLHALQEDYKAVVEECIEMQEVETAVLGNSNPQAAGVVGELVPVVEFYTYEAKYIDGTTALHIPGRVDEEISQQLRRTAEKAFAAIGCQGFARIDFFVRKGDHAVILNEINTIPGFTSISMYPKLWAHCGLSYPQLLDRLIQLGLERNAQ